MKNSDLRFYRLLFAVLFCVVLFQGGVLGVSKSTSTPAVPFAPAMGLHAELDTRGVYLIWENDVDNRPASVQFDYHMYRQEKDSSKRVSIPFVRGVIHTREGDRWTGVDMTIEWEKTYTYWIRPVTRTYSQDGKLIGEVEGDDSLPLEITTHDIFPPAVPERLLSLVSHIPEKKFVDLLWAPNTERDLAGYNVYRRDENSQPVRLNSALITMLSFQDTNVLAAHTYFYSISAVDNNGNESARSQEATAVLR